MRTDSKDGNARKKRRVGCIVGCVVGILLMIAFIATLPFLPRWLGLGRHGIGPPVTIRTMDEVSRITAMRFPTQAELIDAEFLGGGGNYLIAKVWLPRSELDRFLSLNERFFHKKASPLGDDDRKAYFGYEYLPTPLARMYRRGWEPGFAHHLLEAAGGDGTGLGNNQLFIDVDSPSFVVIYLHWQSIGILL